MKRGTDGVRGVNEVMVVTAGRRKRERTVRTIEVAGAQPVKNKKLSPLSKAYCRTYGLIPGKIMQLPRKVKPLKAVLAQALVNGYGNGVGKV